MSTTGTAQMGLREPDRTDWDNYSTGSSYQPPPPALGPDGVAITYYGVAEGLEETKPDNELLNFLIDPIKIVRSGGQDGKTLRFTRASVKPFEKNGAPIKGNPSKLGNYLRACGIQAKPQTNSEWRAAVAASKGKVFPFTIDWEAYNSATGESVKGYLNFPEDPERPGQRKSILKAGDVVTERDRKGNVTGTRVVESEVLFANARLRYFVDAAPKVTR